MTGMPLGDAGWRTYIPGRLYARPCYPASRPALLRTLPSTCASPAPSAKVMNVTFMSIDSDDCHIHHFRIQLGRGGQGRTAAPALLRPPRLPAGLPRGADRGDGLGNGYGPQLLRQDVQLLDRAQVERVDQQVVAGEIGTQAERVTGARHAAHQPDPLPCHGVI